MARTKQTAGRSTGGKAPRKTIASKKARSANFRVTILPNMKKNKTFLVNASSFSFGTNNDKEKDAKKSKQEISNDEDTKDYKLKSVHSINGETAFHIEDLHALVEFEGEEGTYAIPCVHLNCVDLFAECVNKSKDPMKDFPSSHCSICFDSSLLPCGNRCGSSYCSVCLYRYLHKKLGAFTPEEASTIKYTCSACIGNTGREHKFYTGPARKAGILYLSNEDDEALMSNLAIFRSLLDQVFTTHYDLLFDYHQVTNVHSMVEFVTHAIAEWKYERIFIIWKFHTNGVGEMVFANQTAASHELCTQQFLFDLKKTLTLMQLFDKIDIAVWFSCCEGSLITPANLGIQAGYYQSVSNIALGVSFEVLLASYMFAGSLSFKEAFEKIAGAFELFLQPRLYFSSTKTEMGPTLQQPLAMPTTTPTTTPTITPTAAFITPTTTATTTPTVMVLPTLMQHGYVTEEQKDALKSLWDTIPDKKMPPKRFYELALLNPLFQTNNVDWYKYIRNFAKRMRSKINNK